MTNEPNGACAVTGASGYVGSIIARELQKHMPVVRMMRTPRYNGDVAWSLESGSDIVDILRARKIKTLVHAAWDMRAVDPREMERICVHGSTRLFNTAAQAGVERIVFISTISAFEGCRSAYGRTKLSVEASLPENIYAVVLRLGLVFGESAGGMFGAIRNQAFDHRFLPVIGTGSAPQYLLHEKTLADSVLRATQGEFDHFHMSPITLAHPRPWPFRDLIRDIAVSEARRVSLVPIPWPLFFGAARAAELLGLRLPFRSDSILSFVHSDKHPNFQPLTALRIDPIPYQPTAQREEPIGNRC